MNWYVIRTDRPFVTATSYDIIAQGTYEKMKRLCDKHNKANEGLQNPEYYYTVRAINKL